MGKILILSVALDLLCKESGNSLYCTVGMCLLFSELELCLNFKAIGFAFNFLSFLFTDCRYKNSIQSQSKPLEGSS